MLFSYDTGSISLPILGPSQTVSPTGEKNGYTDRWEEELISLDDRVFLRSIIVGLRRYDYPFFWARITVVLLLAKVPVPDECRPWVGSDVAARC